MDADVLLAQQVMSGLGYAATEDGVIDSAVPTLAQYLQDRGEYTGTVSMESVEVVIKDFQELLDERGFACNATGVADQQTAQAVHQAAATYGVPDDPAAVADAMTFVPDA